MLNPSSPLAFKATYAATRVASRLGVAPAGALASKLWFTPWSVPVSEGARAKQKTWLENVEPFTKKIQGHRFAGFEQGDGPAVLLIHGWGERASSMGAFVRPLVAGGYRVIGIDLPAHGDSSGKETNALLNAAVIGSLAEEAGGLHGVIAHSMGAHGAILALHDGAPIHKAVLLAPAVRLEHALLKFNELLALPRRARMGLQRSIERRFGSNVWHDFAADRLARDMDAPVLIVHDRDDLQVPHDDAVLLADAWAGAELISTEGLSHGKITRDGFVIADAIGFLDGLRQRRERPARSESVEEPRVVSRSIAGSAAART